jgi:hypothetical protein
MPWLAQEGIDWESSDEWYAPDGKPLSDDEISQACGALLHTAPRTRGALRGVP